VECPRSVPVTRAGEPDVTGCSACIGLASTNGGTDLASTTPAGSTDRGGQSLRLQAHAVPGYKAGLTLSRVGRRTERRASPIVPLTGHRRRTAPSANRGSGSFVIRRMQHQVCPTSAQRSSPRARQVSRRVRPRPHRPRSRPRSRLDRWVRRRRWSKQPPKRKGHWLIRPFRLSRFLVSRSRRCVCTRDRLRT
jgi:hypothetical protein